MGSFWAASFDVSILGSKIWRPEKVLVWSDNFLASKKCDGAINYFSFFATSRFLVERLCCVKETTKGRLPRVIVSVFLCQLIFGLCVARNGMPRMVGIDAYIISKRTSQTKNPKCNVTVAKPTTGKNFPSASYTF